MASHAPTASASSRWLTGSRIFKLSRSSQTGRVPPLPKSLVERALYGAGRLAQAEPDRRKTALARQAAYYQASTSNGLTSNPSISNVVVTVATGPAAAAKQEGTCVMSKPAVEAHGLREAFSQVQALDELSLAVPTAVGAAVGLSGDLRLRAGHRHTRLAAGVRHPSAGRRPGQHRTGADPLRPAAHDILISLAWSGGSLIVFALLAACTYARMRR